MNETIKNNAMIKQAGISNFSSNVSTEEVHNYLGKVIQAETPLKACFDSLSGSWDNGNVHFPEPINFMSSAFDAVIEDRKSKKIPLTGEEVISTVDALNSLVESPEFQNFQKDVYSNGSVTTDAVNDVQGSEVIAKVIANNIYTYLSSDLSEFVGTVANMQMNITTSPNKKSTKALIYSINPVASQGAGDVVDGTRLTNLNSHETFAVLRRSGTQDFVTNTLVYTFDVKSKSADSSNYAMEHGSNRVKIGNTVELNDYSIDGTTEDTHTESKKFGSQSVTAVFTYSTGKIVVTFAGNVTSGTKIKFEASLNNDEISKVSGRIDSNIVAHQYVSIRVYTRTEIDIINEKRLGLSGLSSSANNLRFIYNKQEDEMNHLKLSHIYGSAVDHASTLVLEGSGADFTRIKDIYKQFTTTAQVIATSISDKTGITNRIGIIGGSAVQAIFSNLSDTTEGNATAISSDSTSIRKLGNMGSNIPTVYNPNHDALYPSVNDVHTIHIVGIPSEQGKRAVLFGMPIPIVPSKQQTSSDDKDLYRVGGEVIISENKDPRTVGLVVALKVKIKA